MNVTKAIIPAAGLGTRFLPYTKAVPKEMMTIVDKPTLHYIVEEAVLSGITDIMIIVSEGKEAIKAYFSPNETYDRLKKPMLEELNDLMSSVRFQFVTQEKLNGNGGAILLAKEFANGEPVAVLFGDDVIYNKNYPATQQLIDAFNRFGNNIILGCQNMPSCEAVNYGVVSYENMRDRIAVIDDIIEKPSINQLPSNLCSIGRFILPNYVFNALEITEPQNGEVVLANAIKLLLPSHYAYAYDIDGSRYDIGNKFGYIKANIEYALRSSFGYDVKKYIKEISDKI